MFHLGAVGRASWQHAEVAVRIRGYFPCAELPVAASVLAVAGLDPAKVLSRSCRPAAAGVLHQFVAEIGGRSWVGMQATRHRRVVAVGRVSEGVPGRELAGRCGTLPFTQRCG